MIVGIATFPVLHPPSYHGYVSAVRIVVIFVIGFGVIHGAAV